MSQESNINCNLFRHSPKELTTDGFITWLFFLLDSDEIKYGDAKQKLFNSLILKPEDRDKKITHVQPKRQVKAKNKKMDILLSFMMEGKEYYVLFEDKTWSTTSDSQLGDYKAHCAVSYEDAMYDYIYLKLGYIDNKEKKIAEQNGYRIISSNKLKNALEGIKNTHLIIEHYYDYLTQSFCVTDDLLEEKIQNNKDGTVFRDSNAQKYYAKKIIERILEHGIEPKPKYGSSFGDPWVEINFSKVEWPDSEYKDELLFWRIDNRKEGYHLRLVQYSWYVDTLCEAKQRRLRLLRDFMKEIIGTTGLKMSRLSSRGKKGNDVAVFLFNENDNSMILEHIGDITAKIAEAHKQIP